MTHSSHSDLLNPPSFKLKFIRRCVAAFILFAFIFGCTEVAENEAGSISIKSGDGQCGLQTRPLADDLVLEVKGPERGKAGDKSSARPAAGIRLAIEPLHKTAQNTTVQPIEATTDAAGNAHVRLTLGEKFGDQYFRVTCPDFPHVAPVIVHAVAGVEIVNNNQEVFAGNKLPKPVVVSAKKLNEKGEYDPLPGLPVYVNQSTGNQKAALSETNFLTDTKGEVTFYVTTAESYTGMYNFIVELGDGFKYTSSDMTECVQVPELRSRGIAVTVLAISRWGIIIAVIGGLAIFIFGMTLMSHGLQQIAGDKLKSLLQLFTGNRIKAVLAGTVITSLIQSSSATTVMVVGFVNAGLLCLTQAIGIIYGASIGTTISAQMISLKLDGLALPAICIGVIFLLVAHKDHWKGIGNTILGFGMLFYGMILMSSEMKVLANFPSFMAFFHSFDCAPQPGEAFPFVPLLGTILVGTILTVIVQSSAATVGMTLALAEAGLINFYTGVPLILGDNIGTTITGLLASIGTSRSSKQTAVASTVFKVLGVLVMIPLFYVNWNGNPCFLELVNQITTGNPFTARPENISRHLANAHTMFNVVSVLLFLPFVNLVAYLSKLIIPDGKGEDASNKHLVFLESHLLNMPSAALDQVVNALCTMAREAVKLTTRATDAFLTADKKPEAELRTMESGIDQAQKDIIAYLVKLTRRNLSENQSLTIPIFMHCVNDVERIGDRAINIFELIDAMPTDETTDAPTLPHFSSDALLPPNRLSQKAVAEIQEIQQNIAGMAELLITGMAKNDNDAFNKVIQKEVEVKTMTSRFEHNHELRLQHQNCTVQKGIVFVEVLANLERISAHLTNLAERAREMSQHRVNFNEHHVK